MQVVCFWSGGKDAAIMLDDLMSGEDDVVGLLTTYEEESGLVPYQSLAIEGVRRQAESVGLPLVEVALPTTASNEVYVERVLTALREEVGDSADSVAFGDLHLSDIRAWRKEMFEETEYRCIFPLWGRSTKKLAREFLRRGFQAFVTTVDTRVLDLAFLGRPFDTSLLEDLPDGIDPCGENGEFHTVVWDGPIFSTPLQGEVGAVVASGPFVSLETSLTIPERG